MNDLSLNTQIDLDLVQTDDFLKAYQSLEETIKQLQEIKSNVDAKIVAEFEKLLLPLGVKTFEGRNGIKFTYTPEGETTRLDTKSLKEEQPDIYNYYSKKSTTKAKMTITIREKK